MPTSRRVLMSGEAPDTAATLEPRGYCSRRLSISENTCPPNSVDDANFAKRSISAHTATAGGGGRRSFLIIFNLLFAVLIWFVAASYKDTFASPSTRQIYDFVSDQITRLKRTTGVPDVPDLPVELVPPPPAIETETETLPAAVPASILAELQVIAEVHQVKEQLMQLQQAVAIKLESKADSQLARDAELEKMRSVVSELTKRLEDLQEEAAVRSAPTPEPSTTPAPKETKPNYVNLANQRLGARIWEEKTTLTKDSFVFKLTSGALDFSPRYSETARRVQTHRKPDSVLDEHDIRGYGDCYCHEFKNTEDNWLRFGVILPYEHQKITALQFEHVAPELDHLPEFRPVFAKLEAYDKFDLKDVQTLELSYEDGISRHEVTLNGSADRLAFSFKCADSYSCCLYRVRVFGVFVRDDMQIS